MAATNVNQQFDLTGKVALITGSAGFLGQRFTQALREAGATVIATDITDAGDLTMDVTDKLGIATAFQKVKDEHGTIDIVINNAAIDPKFNAAADHNDKQFENYPEELLTQSINVNLKGYVLVAQEAIKHMLKQSSAKPRDTKRFTGGVIINIASIYGVVGPDQSIYPNNTQKPVDYAITKGGVVMLTKYLATTYGPQGIRTNTYTLGGVEHDHDETFKKNYGARVPLGRMMNATEVGAPLVFLASDAASYMNGANLIVDGGLTAW